MTIIEAAAELLDMVVKAEIIHDETIAELRARAERAEAALVESASSSLRLREELADVYRRAERAEAALAECESMTDPKVVITRSIKDAIARAERAEAALAEMTERAEHAEINVNVARARGDAAIALARAQADVIEAIPWQALLNLTQRPGEAIDLDMDCVIYFLNLHAPWVLSDNDLLSGDNQPG